MVGQILGLFYSFVTLRLTNQRLAKLAGPPLDLINGALTAKRALSRCSKDYQPSEVKSILQTPLALAEFLSN
jgi:hypothetical protein